MRILIKYLREMDVRGFRGDLEGGRSRVGRRIRRKWRK
jgi:hypothetical protein